MPYVTVEGLLEDDRGMGVAEIPAATLAGIARAASLSIDAYAGFTFDFRWHGGTWPDGRLADLREPPEYQPFEGNLQLTLNNAPIRAIYWARLENVLINGVLSGLEFGPEAVVTNPIQGTFQASSFTLRYTGDPYLFTLGSGDIEPFWLVNYTSGYDGGKAGNPWTNPPMQPIVVAPDGLVLPYPDWLVEATRYEALRLCGQYFEAELGLTEGMQAISVGPLSYRRPSRTPAKEQNPIDADARKILDAHLEDQIVVATLPS